MWGEPNVSEVLQLQETAIGMPSAAGGQVTRTLQRAGLLKKLRFLAEAELVLTGYTTAPGKSALGPLGAFINNISIKANGQTDLCNLSGFGATIYNEIQNRDGSVLSHPVTIAAPAHSVAIGAELMKYDAIGATGTFNAAYPFEINFALPFSISQQMQELGLWLLQNQAIDVSITANFNALYAAAASVNNLWSAGTGIVGTPTLANCKLNVERELYNIPNNPKDYPDLRWAHQIIETPRPFTSSFGSVAIPRAGLLLRAVVINLDGNYAAIENTDIDSMSFIYGSNETPISRPGWAWAHEFQMDYNRLPMKGVVVMDFYKWGENGLKFVKSTEDLANLRIETKFKTATTGTQLVILDRLIPVATR